MVPWSDAHRVNTHQHRHFKGSEAPTFHLNAKCAKTNFTQNQFFTLTPESNSTHSRPVAHLGDEVALQPRHVRVLPPFGAGHPLPGRTFGEVRGVGRVLEQLAVAEAGAVDPGDGEVEVPLRGEVAREEGGGQQQRVGFTAVRLRD